MVTALMKVIQAKTLWFLPDNFCATQNLKVIFADKNK